MMKNTENPTSKQLGKAEFITLCACLISLVALSIDSMLPALHTIGLELGVAHPNDSQLIVSVLFAGLACGQLVTGPLSDSIGRKLSIYIGMSIFLFGCFLSIISESFETMLLARFLQGVGVSAPRIVTLALVRDLYAGRSMAEIMSFVMAVFIVVPALAPLLGQTILLFAEWRWIFMSLALVGTIGLVWLALRQPETLSQDKRLPFSGKQIWIGVKETCTNRISFGYTVAAGIIFGAFVGYLNSAPQIFRDVYGIIEEFPLYFAILALSIGAASVVNGKLVMKYGMRKLLLIALISKIILCIGFMPYAYFQNGIPELPLFMGWGMAVFFCTGILFGNVNSLALEPLGHIAGIASSVIGALSTFVSILLGFYIGHSFDGTVLPLVMGFGILAISGFFIVIWTERKL